MSTPATPMPAETGQTPTAVAPPTPSTPVSAITGEPVRPSNPQQVNREALYAQYYGGEQQSPVVPAVEPPAQGEPPVQPPPAVVAPPTPPPTPDYASTIAALTAQVEAMQARLNPPPPPPSAPTERDWVDLLQAGDKKGFEDALAAKIKSNVAPEVLNKSVTEALELFRVEQDINSFVNDLRVKSPEVLPMEEWIGLEVQAVTAAARSNGKIQSTSDYVKIYKDAVNASVGRAKNLIQQYRAAGKTDAMTTRTDVVSASTLTPNAIDVNRAAPETQATPPVETTQDYLARRQAQSLGRRGLAS